VPSISLCRTAFLLARTVMPHMLKRKFGRLVYISGRHGFFGDTTHRAHNATCKSALHGFAKAIAREFGEFNITANTIAPGIIDTERDWSQYPRVSNDRQDPNISLRRWGTCQEVAGACVYLASNHGAYVIGHLVHVNGGSHTY
jgi:3-oxoacyl-[acyl-carrier protein] reductase